jgi:hypothetical protein
MYEAMGKISDMAIGEAPHPKDMGPGAIKRREARMMFADLMHQFVAMTMREGARRAFEERGMATVAAPMKGRH